MNDYEVMKYDERQRMLVAAVTVTLPQPHVASPLSLLYRMPLSVLFPLPPTLMMMRIKKDEDKNDDNVRKDDDNE